MPFHGAEGILRHLYIMPFHDAVGMSASNNTHLTRWLLDPPIPEVDSLHESLQHERYIIEWEERGPTDTATTESMLSDLASRQTDDLVGKTFDLKIKINKTNNPRDWFYACTKCCKKMILMGATRKCPICRGFEVQGLNVKKLLPPYLGVQHTPEDLLTGVSFASGATGFDPLTPVIVGVISLEQQLVYFDEYRSKLVGIAGEEHTKRIIDGALFVVCAGTDDIANTYYTTPLRSAHYDVPAYVDLLLVGVESFLRNVSARGAKRIGFVGLPPIGCVPSQRTLGGGPHRSCVPERNAAAQLYNTKVQELIRELSKDKVAFPTLVYLDIYTVIQDMVDNGGKYGFSETTRGCCSTGTVEVAVLCDARFAPVCDDVSEHVFFDSYHPTQRAYKVIVDYIFEHYIQFLNL